jgi:hypothetical protein
MTWRKEARRMMYVGLRVRRVFRGYRMFACMGITFFVAVRSVVESVG